jgi:hypothetical protein
MAGMIARVTVRMGNASAARIVFMSAPGNWIPPWRES